MCPSDRFPVLPVAQVQGLQKSGQPRNWPWPRWREGLEISRISAPRI